LTIGTLLKLYLNLIGVNSGAPFAEKRADHVVAKAPTGVPTAHVCGSQNCVAGDRAAASEGQGLSAFASLTGSAETGIEHREVSRAKDRLI